MRKLFAVALLVLALAAPATAQYIQPGGSGGGTTFTGGTITDQMAITPSDNGTPLYLTSQAADTADGLTVIGGAARAAYFGRATAGSSHLVGLYQPSGDTGDFLYAVNNVTNVFRLTYQGYGLFPAGTAASPSIAYSGDTDTGFVFGSNAVYLVAGGAAKATVLTTGLGPGATAANDLGTSTSVWRSLYLGTSSYGSSAKTLTESSATIFAKVAVASGSSWSGTIIYEIKANDATDFQTLGGVLSVQAVNKAGTITCQVAEAAPAVPVALTSAGTLTNTMTCADAGSNVLNILANSVSSLTQTFLSIGHRADTTDVVTYTPQ
jgi:hypothetical protein